MIIIIIIINNNDDVIESIPIEGLTRAAARTIGSYAEEEEEEEQLEELMIQQNNVRNNFLHRWIRLKPF